MDVLFISENVPLLVGASDCVQFASGDTFLQKIFHSFSDGAGEFHVR